ncbi:hypothetical protein [Listeria booriae]|uniref:hypothetical protein n=1 Tax=Listeria booriae TaxID=1552123 RepID=UPI0016252336|nr:hypothetical protein [Listeria booriae]
MTDHILKFIKAKSKLFYLLILTGVLIFVLFNGIKVIFTHETFIFQLVLIVFKHMLSLSTAIILVVATILLLRHSNIVSNEMEQDYLERQGVDIAVGNDIVGLEIKKYYTRYTGKHFNIRVKNLYHGSIVSIKGTLNFYTYENDRIYSVPIEIDHLFIKQNYTVSNFDPKHRAINSFAYYEFYIEKLKTDVSSFEDIRLISRRIVHTFFYELNMKQFSDHFIGKFRVRYNLVWLKERGIRIRSWVRFFCSKKIYRVEHKPVVEFFELMVRVTKILMLIVFLVIVLLGLMYVIYDLSKMIIAIAKLLISK